MNCWTVSTAFTGGDAACQSIPFLACCMEGWAGRVMNGSTWCWDWEHQRLCQMPGISSEKLTDSLQWHVGHDRVLGNCRGTNVGSASPTVSTPVP
jgi:hypothetical protein